MPDLNLAGYYLDTKTHLTTCESIDTVSYRVLSLAFCDKFGVGVGHSRNGFITLTNFIMILEFVVRI